MMKTDDQPPRRGSLPGKKEINNDDLDVPVVKEIGGWFRGVAAAARAKLPAIKVASAKATRYVGTNRSLAFASEGAVAGNSFMPRWMYYGAWGLSGVAISADITTRIWDTPADKKLETAVYWTTFHVPASLLLPAWIIHKVVHAAEHSMEHHSYAKKIPMRFRAFVPAIAAMFSIIPVVPAVDYAAEFVMEPTLGTYLGLKFDHHHNHDTDETSSTPIQSGKDDKEKKD